MEIIKTKIDGVVIVEPKVFGDHRGFFMESWSKRTFEEAGLHYDFVQDNHSSSTVKGTLRGIHFQRGQCKFTGCSHTVEKGCAVRAALSSMWPLTCVRPARPTSSGLRSS